MRSLAIRMVSGLMCSIALLGIATPASAALPDTPPVGGTFGGFEWTT